MLADEPSKRISSSQVVIQLKSIENEVAIKRITEFLQFLVFY
jgi:hypothetical protein